jgi:hypothetical protein
MDPDPGDSKTYGSDGSGLGSRSEYMSNVMSCQMSNTSLITNALTISREGMKLEAIDPEHQSLICVVSVVEVQGHR